MSLYIYNYTDDWAIVGADSRLCTIENNEIYQVHDNAQKIFSIDNSICTIGGNEFAGNLLISNIKESNIINNYYQIQTICKLIDEQYNINNDAYFLEFTLLTYINNKHVVYNIASYNDYSIVLQESNKSYISNFFGGIDINDATKIYNDIVYNTDMIDTYRQIYNSVSSEKIGGNLTIYVLNKGRIENTFNFPIKDNMVIQKVNRKTNYSYNIIGQQGIFNAIKMYDENNNLVAQLGKYISSDGVTEKNGLLINGGALEIVGNTEGQFLVLGANYNNLVLDSQNGLVVTRQDNKVRTVINATYGIKIQKSSDNGSTWVDILSFDDDGNGLFSGIVDAQDYRINGETIIKDDKILGDFIDSINAGIINAGNLTLSGDMKISNADGTIEIGSTGIFIKDTSGNSTILNQYGINPKSLKWFKNMCFNSSFERFDSQTNIPLNWSGGVVDDTANFYGSYSMRLDIGQESHQINDGVVNSYHYTNIKNTTRISFHKKMGAVRASVYNYADNTLFTLSDGGTYKDFVYNDNWEADYYTFAFNHVINGLPQQFYIKFENIDTTHSAYIDGVVIEPDFTGMWSSFYTDGPESSSLDGISMNGIPSGGSTNQILRKKSSTDYDVEWDDRGSKVWVDTTTPTNMAEKDVFIDTDDYTRYDTMSITYNTTLVVSDPEVVFASGTINITLHTATTAGIIKKIYNIGSGTITIIGTIKGQTNMTLSAGQSVELITTGSGWWY